MTIDARKNSGVKNVFEWKIYLKIYTRLKMED